MKKALIVLMAAVIGGSAVGLMASQDREEDEHRGQHDAGYGEHQQQDTNRGEAGEGFFRGLFRDEDDAQADRAWLADTRLDLYRAECGDCHIAYPPDMLPTVSWQATLASLEDHFGENAELDLETRARIANFLGDHAAGRGKGDYAERMWRATRGMAAPLRITETDYFVGQHHEIPLKMVTDNPEVKSFSRCDACHAGAAEGSFDEHEVRIAGYGKWDD